MISNNRVCVCVCVGETDRRTVQHDTYTNADTDMHR